MYKWTKIGGAIALLCAVGLPNAHSAGASVGRAATPAEIAAWNIDVRPDFQGLSNGSGSVSRGAQIWDSKCASCHGSFGESNQVFTPIVGGTTAKDIASGRVAALANNKEPQRSTLMKLATVSTLWDYIRRAMPWNAPKSLSNDEVYAVTAYILNLGEIVPDNFTLTEQNIAQVRLPNRLGMQQQHGLWQSKGKGDVLNTACMQNCAPKAEITSRFPASALNSHGDLAQQNRLFGAVRGQATAPKMVLASADASTVKSPTLDGAKLAQHHQCIACHSAEDELVGPPWRVIASINQGKSGVAERLLKKVQQGGSGDWGEVPMPAQGHIKTEELQAIIRWVLDGAK